jgi:GAF domain-containing protein
MTDYKLLASQIKAFGAEEPFFVPLFANISALLWEAMPDINWAGFYFLRGGALILGPFQGRPACIRIGLDKGVCGAAARENKIQRVRDVHEFPGHIACDCASNSEIVLPVRSSGAVRAVLDIDSPKIGRFSPEDEEGLALAVREIESCVLF